LMLLLLLLLLLGIELCAPHVHFVLHSLLGKEVRVAKGMDLRLEERGHGWVLIGHCLRIGNNYGTLELLLLLLLLLLWSRARVAMGDRLGNARKLLGSCQWVCKVVGACVFEHGDVLCYGNPEVLKVVGGVGKRWAVVVFGIVEGIVGMRTHLILFFRDRSEGFELAVENHGETVTTGRLFDTGDASAVSPLVELAAEGVGLEFEGTKLAGGEGTVAAGCVDVSDRGVDNGRLGRTANLREVREQSG
jgi:hypothetical protein